MQLLYLLQKLKLNKKQRILRDVKLYEHEIVLLKSTYYVLLYIYPGDMGIAHFHNWGWHYIM